MCGEILRANRRPVATLSVRSELLCSVEHEGGTAKWLWGVYRVEAQGRIPFLLAHHSQAEAKKNWTPSLRTRTFKR